MISSECESLGLPSYGRPLPHGVATTPGFSLIRGDREPLAEVGNSGHTNEPHLHLQVQDSPADSNAERTLPMVFRNVQISQGGPWRASGELRSGDLIRALGE